MPLLERGGNAAASLRADLAALGRAAEALGEPDPRRGAARARDVLEHPDRDLLPGSVLGALEARAADTPAADEE
jgi:hypothetical protein